MSLFICKVHYTKPFSEVEKVLSSHREYLKKEGYDKKLLLASGPMIPKTGGLIIAAFASMSEAQRFASNDPFCIHDVARYEFIEFEPVLSDASISGFIAR